jgi:hypothetical protein
MSETTPNPIAKVIGRAWADPAFHQLLLSDPKTALAQEGIPIPDGHTVEMHEDNDSTSHFVLPRKPAELGTSNSGSQGLICLSNLICLRDLICLAQPKPDSAPATKDLICLAGSKS